MGDVDTRADARIGARLANRYLVRERLDSGGMATVYRARDEILGRDVAIKVMHPALAADPSFVERFRQEAQNAARLSHPNICAVYDYGEASAAVHWPGAHSDLFIVMELVTGSTLRTLLDRFGRLDPDRCRHVARAVAAALDHAHDKGIIHRDVKPENVLLTPAGDVKVVDFGIAKALGPHSAHLTIDRPIGTVAYVAPEQITATNVDGRADVYALGAMTYEMLTGRPPFRGDTPQAVAASRLHEPVLSPGISPQIDAAVTRATAKSPDDRFATPGDFARALGDDSPMYAKDPTLASTDLLPLGGTSEPKPEPSAPLPAAAVEVLPFQARLYRRRSRRFRVLTTIVVVLAIAAAGVYAVIPKPTSVPDLRGQTLAEAKSEVEREGMKVGDINHVFHDVAAEGTIVGSDPDPGTSVKKGAVIDLLVSKGAELFSVPDVIGKPIDDAKTAMEQAGFSLSVGTEEYNDKIAKGAVVRYGPPRTQAKRGTSFEAVVSKGPELLPVPTVSGKTPAQAEKAIEDAGFGFATSSDYSDTVDEGTVITSNPAGGAMAPKGSTITAIVSKGPRPFPMPDLVGLARSEAKAKARSLGLVVRNEYPVPGSGKPSGQVQGQNPTAGSSVRKGTPVDIYYAN